MRPTEPSRLQVVQIHGAATVGVTLPDDIRLTEAGDVDRLMTAAAETAAAAAAAGAGCVLAHLELAPDVAWPDQLETALAQVQAILPLMEDAGLRLAILAGEGVSPEALAEVVAGALDAAVVPAER